MTTHQRLTLYKFLAVSAAFFYLYKLSRAQGKSLQGRVNPEKIVGLGSQLLPEELRPYAKKFGVHAMNKIIQSTEN
jgi:hypothetical protein